MNAVSGARPRRTAAAGSRSAASISVRRGGFWARLVSPQLRLLMARRLAELAGLALGSAALALSVALASYDARDPSLDTASARHIANLAGAPGAMVADLLIQGFGVAALLPALTMLAWAWRIAAHRGLGSILVRLATLAAALPCLAGAVVAAAGTHGLAVAWPSLAGPGGAAGAAMASPLLRIGHDLGLRFAPVAAALICLLVGCMFAWVAFGLSLNDWRAVARGIAGAVGLGVRAGGAVVALGRRVGRLSHRISDPLAAQFDDHEGIELPPPMFDRGPPDPDRLIRAPVAQAAAADARQAEAPVEAGPASSRPSLRARVITARARAAAPQQEVLPLNEPGWVFPSLSLLKAPPPRTSVGPSEESLHANARLLESVLSDYGVQGTIRDIHPGPVVTLYELEPAPGIRSARVIGLADDVARSLSVTAVRIATVPGRNVIGIEVPNARRETVFLSELIGSEEWSRQGGKLGLALGKDISGAPQIADLARMPHLLIAGTTGSGKSVGINAMILSLLYKLSPDQCRLILIDPKMLELSVYDGIPHLMAPVVTEPAKAVSALKWTVREMERRYRSMTGLGVRNIGGYNDRVAEAKLRGEVVTRRVQTGFDPETNRPTFEEQPLTLETLPLIVVVIDEMADLMMVAGKEIEAAVQRLAQMARAAGIHVIMATQRPSVDVITGTIKANFPTRISFQVISKFDSRTILGEQGAEQLLGMGDMLYMAGGGRITRVHGPFVTDREVEDVVAFLRSQGEPAYLDEVTEPPDEDASNPMLLPGMVGAMDGEKGLFDQAVAVVAREGKASTSFIQRHLTIGYNRAAKLIEQMEKEGIISPANHVGRREVLVRRTRDDE
jgi:S-DNA-T family DNA segregation ATPase FtsK/SpoIIIE